MNETPTTDCKPGTLWSYLSSSSLPGDSLACVDVTLGSHCDCNRTLFTLLFPCMSERSCKRWMDGMTIRRYAIDNHACVN
jgi:hypothetical protein